MVRVAARALALARRRVAGHADRAVTRPAARAFPAAPSTAVIAARFAGAVRRAAHPELRGRRLRAQAAAAALVGAAGSTVGLAAPRERVAVSAQRQYDGGEEERSCDMLHHAPPGAQASPCPPPPGRHNPAVADRRQAVLWTRSRFVGPRPFNGLLRAARFRPCGCPWCAASASVRSRKPMFCVGKKRRTHHARCPVWRSAENVFVLLRIRAHDGRRGRCQPKRFFALIISATAAGTIPSQEGSPPSILARTSGV